MRRRAIWMMTLAVALPAGAPGTAGAQLLPPLGPPPPAGPPAPPAPPVVEPGAPGPETTHVGGDATRRGAVSGGSLAPPLRALWRVNLDARVGRPVVGGGRVYVPSGASVVALDLATGRELWRSATPGSLAYGSEKLVVSSFDRVTALDAASGAALWSFGGSSIDSPPLIAGDIVVVQGQGLFGLDLATGAPRWKGGTNDGTNGEPSVSGDRIFEYGGCTLAAADRRTGGLLWSRNSGCTGGGGGRVVVHRDRVYVPPRSGRAYAVVRASDGTDVPGPSVDAVVGDIGLDVSDGLRAIELGSGRVLWTAAKASSSFNAFGRPLGVGDLVFRGRFSGDLEALRAADGTRRWDGRLRAPRSFSDGRFDENVQLAAGRDVLVVGRGGTIDALGVATGTTGRIPVTLPRTRFAEVQERIVVRGTVGGALLPTVRLEVDEYPFGRFAKAGSRARPDDKGAYALPYRPQRNVRVRVVDTGGATGPSRHFTLFAYPRIRFSVRNVSNTVTARVRVTGSQRVRFRGRRVVLYVARASANRLVRLGSARMSGPSRRSGRATIRFAALGNVGRRDFLFACVPGIERTGHGNRRDPVQRRCGASSIRF